MFPVFSSSHCCIQCVVILGKRKPTGQEKEMTVHTGIIYRWLHIKSYSDRFGQFSVLFHLVNLLIINILKIISHIRGMFYRELIWCGNASDNSLFVYHDFQDKHYTWIQNIQMYYRSMYSHRGHQFCPKCFGRIRGSIISTHLCIYEYRCFDCGDYKSVRSAAE